MDFEQAVPQFEAAGRLLHGRLGAPFNPNTPPSTSTAASTSASTWAPASYSTDRHTAIGGLPSSGPVHPSGPFATTNSGARCASHGLGSSSPAKSPWGTSICIVGCVDAGAGVLGPLLLDVSWLRPLRHLRLEHITLEGFGIVLGLNPLSGLLAACPDIKVGGVALGCRTWMRGVSVPVHSGFAGPCEHLREAPGSFKALLPVGRSGGWLIRRALGRVCCARICTRSQCYLMVLTVHARPLPPPLLPDCVPRAWLLRAAHPLGRRVSGTARHQLVLKCEVDVRWRRNHTTERLRSRARSGAVASPQQGRCCTLPYEIQSYVCSCHCQ